VALLAGALDGLDSRRLVPILWGMLRSKRARLRTLVPLAARNRALDYLAKNCRLSDDLRYQLTEVVNGYIGRCDEDAARAGNRVDARAISGGWAEAAVLRPSMGERPTKK